MTTGKWFDFNDSSVKEISPEAYKETFGENEKKIYDGFFFFWNQRVHAHVPTIRSNT